jgi:hypothetical protein
MASDRLRHSDRRRHRASRSCDPAFNLLGLRSGLIQNRGGTEIVGIDVGRRPFVVGFGLAGPAAREHARSDLTLHGPTRSRPRRDHPQRLGNLIGGIVAALLGVSRPTTSAHLDQLPLDPDLASSF